MHNALFEDDVCLEGVIVSKKPSNLPGIVPGGASMVISQRWLVAADHERPHPNEDEIITLMEELGFEPIPDSFFGWFSESKSLLVLDAKPDNFVKTADGILPFDLMLLSLRDSE